MEKETKEKLDCLEKQTHQLKGYDAMESVNYSDLYVYLDLKLPPKFKMHDFKK